MVLREMRKWNRLKKGLDPFLIEELLENPEVLRRKQIKELYKAYVKV